MPSPKQTLTATARGLSRLCRRADLHVAGRYAILCSDRHKSEWIYEIDDSEALDWVLRGSNKEGIRGPLEIARSMAGVANRFSLLQQCYPTYLFVSSPDSTMSSPESGQILLTGKNRSSILHLNDGTISKAAKIPNSHAQSPLTVQEIELLAELRASNGKVSTTIPTGEEFDTRFGHEWHEDPAAGTPLLQVYDTDPADIEEALSIVLDWLAQFQTTYERERQKKSAKTLRSELSISQFDLEPPELPDKPLNTCTVPMHGDLFGTNIYIDEGEVVEVIDWEWSSDCEPPGGDFGFLLLEVANYVGSDFADGFETLFLDPSPYRPIVRDAIETHANRIDISIEELLLSLPYAYLYRIRKDLRYNRRLDIDWPGRVAHVWDHYEEMKQLFIEQ